mmetsp:Transcript_22951/g.49660  ORF Transcript_22951/g.49660 Transcript_22951/m.49660 type:complete len:510 (+) Transcript_22951:53-1582(+)
MIGIGGDIGMRSKRQEAQKEMKPRMMATTAILATIMAANGVRAFQMPNLASVVSFQPIINSLAAPEGASKWKLRLSATDASELDSHSHDTENKIVLEQKTWMFQNKYPIAYEVASNVVDNDANNDDDVEVVPILLLNGFGVGSFHQHRLMRQLLLENNESQLQQQYLIYGIDYLGQGKSWPENCDDGKSNDELNLGYSADLWLDQLKGFIEEVIVPSSTSKKVHLAGNSVGGYLSTILTNRHPHLISSLTLMNATPVWGLNLPGWDGKLPAPPLPKMVGRALFDTIRNEDVIDKYLETAYVHREAFDGTFGDSFNECGTNNNALGAKIQACTESKGGHAAFASILWSAPASERKEGEICESPPTPADFYGALKSLPVDVLLLFGSDDPWCTPAVAKRMHTTLFSRDDVAVDAPPVQRYISLENVGHCPNHEAPTAVAKVLLPWIKASSALLSPTNIDDADQSRSKVPLVSSSGSAEIREPWGDIIAREVSIEESQDLGMIDRIVSSMVG